MFKSINFLLLIFTTTLVLTSCGSNDDGDATEEEMVDVNPMEEEKEEENPEPVGGDNGKDCTNKTPIIIEKDGVIRAEVESAIYSGEWKLLKDKPNTLGDGYLFWNGKNYFGETGIATLVYKIQINTPGTYQFQFRHLIATGTDRNEYNDVWLRMDDADDFFGKKGEKPGPDAVAETVYPRGGKNPQGPFPKGTTKNGWFKVFAKQFNWTWKGVTGDNQAYEIFATFNTAKVYTLEISARSMGYGMDQFVLFQEGKNPKSDDAFLSEITCEDN